MKKLSCLVIIFFSLFFFVKIVDAYTTIITCGSPGGPSRPGIGKGELSLDCDVTVKDGTRTVAMYSSTNFYSTPFYFSSVFSGTPDYLVNGYQIQIECLKHSNFTEVQAYYKVNGNVGGCSASGCSDGTAAQFIGRKGDSGSWYVYRATIQSAPSTGIPSHTAGCWYKVVDDIATTWWYTPLRWDSQGINAKCYDRSSTDPCPVDTFSPTITLISAPANLTIGSSFSTFRFGSSDDTGVLNTSLYIDGVEYKTCYGLLSTTNLNCEFRVIASTSSFKYSDGAGFTPGAHTYFFTAYDSTGRIGRSPETGNYTFNVIDPPPTITLSSVGGDNVPSGFPSTYDTNDTTPSVVFTTNENANCRISLTDQSYADMGSSKDCTIGQNTTNHTCTPPDLGSDGSKKVYLSCQGPRGNANTSADNTDVNINLFTTIATRITGVGFNFFRGFADYSIPYTIYHISDPSISDILFLDPNDAICRIYDTDQGYSESSGTPCTGSGSGYCRVSNTSVGSYTKYIACKNSARVTHTADNNFQVEWSVEQDNQPPITSIASIDRKIPPASGITAIFSCEDNISGCNGVLYCMDTNNTCTPIDGAGSRADFPTPTSTTTFPVDITSRYIRFSGIDKSFNNILLGNKELVHSFDAYTLDNHPPSTTITITKSVSSNSFTLNCEDDFAGCKTTYYCTSTTSTCTPTTVYTGGSININDRTYINYYSLDNIANTETIKTKFFQIAPDCSGNISILLSPTNAQVDPPYGPGTHPNISGLTNCNDKRINFKLDSCTELTTSYGGCSLVDDPLSSCSNPDLKIYPGNTVKTYKLAACIDKDGDGNYSDPGEQDTADFVVWSSAPPPVTTTCGSSTDVRATGLVSTPALTGKFGTSGGCAIDGKTAFFPKLIKTFDDLESLYYTQDK